MSDIYNVLIFPAGSEIAAEVFDALKFEKSVRLFGGASVPDHSEMLYERLVSGIPYFDAPGFVDRLNRVIDDCGIDLVFPARDDVQLFLMEHQAEIRARVVSSPLGTVHTCRSKSRTYRALDGCAFLPETYGAGSVPPFPVFVKPDVGEGSKGARLARTPGELAEAMSDGRDYVVCEYLPGTEYTVDCFTGAGGRVLACMPRTRLRTKAGISVRSASVPDDGRFRAIAEAINARIEFDGAWFFQLKEREGGDLVLMEVSPRIPGTMGLSRNRGVNFPMLTIYQMLGVPVEVIDNGYGILLDKAFVSRFRLDLSIRHVYMDYDDTVTTHGAVNPQAMAFLYQCRNKGVPVTLLTRHEGDVHEELASRRIDPGLFDEIVHLREGEGKSSHIEPEGAILVDDSFRERSEVRRVLGIPVFGPDCIESLLDWRM